jgi:6-pyruvoyltetrahydropterin/6-carboxytetrahydropterin synthase
VIGELYYVTGIPFEGARKVDILPSDHQAYNLHGHSFFARVRAKFPFTQSSFSGSEVSELKDVVSQVVKQLDYSFLNDHLTTPTDENLARWVRDRIQIPSLDVVGIQSTSNQGVDLDENDIAHIWRRFRFESAHKLPNVPDGHQCGRMHGHGFEVIIHASQNIDGQDIGVDFDHIEKLWQPIQSELHMACLNDIPGLQNPTSEVLASWIWKRLKPQLEELSWITIYETTTAGCHFDGQNYRIWKEFRFESALRLMDAPVGDRRRKLHGHSYLSRLHLTAPLDDVMGWTVDYGDVKELFKPAYKQLDHNYLNEISGIEDGSIVSICGWMQNQLTDVLPALDRIDLYETPGCGVVLSWGGERPALPV